MPKLRERFVTIYPISISGGEETVSHSRAVDVAKLADLLQTIAHLTGDFILTKGMNTFLSTDILTIEQAASVFLARRDLEGINRNRPDSMKLSLENGVYRQKKHEKIDVSPVSPNGGSDEDNQDAAA